MLNDNIRNCRKQKNLSQEELAARLNVVRQTISKWEKGLSVPDAGMLIQIAKALDTSVNALLGEPVPEPEDQETIESVAARLEQLNEQFAARIEKRRKVWRIVFIAVGILAMLGILQEILLCFHLQQANAELESTAGIIGGADGPTSIFVSNLSYRTLSALATATAAIVAVVGIYRTRRR